MLSNAFLRLRGQKTGEIKGSVTEKGHENLILVTALSHEIALHAGGGVGKANGKRQHRPLVITKELDRASPLLRAALVTNETMKEWELQLRRPTGAGPVDAYFTIKLTKASIASIALRIPDTQDPALTKLEPYEEVAFVYQQIEWTWVDGGVTSGDSWTSGV